MRQYILRGMKLLIGFIVSVLVIGAATWYLIATPAPKHTGGAPDYKNATYRINGTPVTLIDGVSVTETAPGSASKITTRYFGNEVRGDFNNDGTEDVAFLLTSDGGGSGTFYYVVAALMGIDSYQGTNAVFLGDRIAPQTTEFKDGKIVVNYADRKPNEPMTAIPSVGVSKYLKVENGMLVEIIADSGKPKSGIQGTVMIGPTCPVMKNPPDPNCADKPYAAKLILYGKDGTSLIQKFSADSAGKFSLVLTPGEYNIKGDNSASPFPRCAESGNITVSPNVFREVTIECDTGIR